MAGSILILHASGTCPSAGSSGFSGGSCCFRWNKQQNDWEFVSSDCQSGKHCPTGTEGVTVEPEHDKDYIRVPCVPL